jgi:hypothetical protein
MFRIPENPDWPAVAEELAGYAALGIAEAHVNVPGPQPVPLARAGRRQTVAAGGRALSTAQNVRTLKMCPDRHIGSSRT